MKNLDVEVIAALCHEINRVYCESIGDMSQPKWSDAPEWQTQSARKGVMFHLSNPDATPADSHVSWMKEKIDTGWVYGAVKDPELKTHPCLVPYYQLPAEQQAKDKLFSTIIETLR